LLVTVACGVVVSGSARAQEESLEARLADLEARVAKLEEQSKSTVESSGGSAAGPVDMVLDEAPVSMTLVKKEFHEGDLLSGEVGDRILLELEFKSDLNKAVKAFTGIAIFRDVFERDVLRASLTCSKPLKPRAKLRWSGWLGYQQFDENHRRLRKLAESELDTDFILERVIYSDGSRVMFAEPDEARLVQNKLVGDGTEETSTTSGEAPAAPGPEQTLGQEEGVPDMTAPSDAALP
jgi:hypothetical protein